MHLPLMEPFVHSSFEIVSTTPTFVSLCFLLLPYLVVARRDIRQHEST